MLALDLAFALDPVLFAKEALNFYPDPWQEKVLRWSGRRLLLCCSRQSGKSTTTAILALHRALFYPKSLILLVSPSLRQSSELFRKVQEFLRELPPEMQPELLEDNKLSLVMKNKSRIVSLPSSEGTIRGFSGASLIIEDEAARVSDDLYFAIRPMLAVSNGRLILMSTPFGKRGHFFKEWAEGGDTWERIKITAYDCPRISREFLEEERQAMGDWWFRQEYLCEFVETEDNVFTYEQVMKALDDSVKPLFGGGEDV
ncbi:terminase family protein [Thermovorax subterraneus]|nr:terminase family protein [Thermovorax subterraneus]